MRYEGQVFGDYVGTDAEDIFVEWSQDFEKIFYKLGFDRERSGIQTKASPQFKNQYSVEVGYRINSNSNITLRYAYEDINNLGNVQGERQRNQFLGVEYAINF
jgi:predicted porin